MTPYIIILLFTILIFITHSFKNEKLNLISSFTWVIIVSVFVGLQDGVGEDSLTYRSWARMNIDEFHDISAFLIVNIVNYLHLPDVAIFFVYTFIAYLFLTLFFLQYPKDFRIVGALLLFSNIYFIQSFNIIRQIAAASVFIYGAALFIKGKKISYLFLTLSPLIHLTAILAVIILFISKYIKLGPPVLLVYIISIVIFLIGGVMPHLKSFAAILAVYDDHYEYLTDRDGNVYASVGLQYLLSLFYGFMLYIHRNTPLLIKYKETVSLMFVGLILYNLLASEITFFRMSYYFYFFIYVTIPLLIGSLNMNYRRLTALGLSLVYIVQFVIILSSNKEFFPYKSVLF